MKNITRTLIASSAALVLSTSAFANRGPEVRYSQDREASVITQSETVFERQANPTRLGGRDNNTLRRAHYAQKETASEPLALFTLPPSNSLELASNHKPHSHR